MSTISSAFMYTIKLRLESLSASTPAGSENSISGTVSVTSANMACVCEAASSSGPAFMPASERRPSVMTTIFQALSLNAPKNCAISNPRSGRLAGSFMAPIA